MIFKLPIFTELVIIFIDNFAKRFHLKTTKMKNTNFTSALDKKELNRLNVSLVSENGKCTEVMYQYLVYDIDNDQTICLLQYKCGHNFMNSEEIVSKKEKKTINLVTNTLIDGLKTAENRIRTKWEYSKIQHKKGLEILNKIVPKETVEKQMELTFDFVSSLIANNQQIDSLPENFKLAFIENKDELILIEERKNNDKASNNIYVQVINTFKIL